jgi:hypothetical protein
MMTRLAREYFSRIWKTIVINILYSLVLAFIGWFFLNLVLHVVETGFFDIWRSVYIVLVVIFGLIDTVSIPLLHYMIHRFMKRFDLTFDDGFDAFIKYRLLKKRPLKDWTREWLELQLAAHRFADSLASVKKAVRSLR